MSDHHHYLAAGADEVIYGKDISREDLETRAEEGKGVLLTGFQEIHSYYMAIASKANRQGHTTALKHCDPSFSELSFDLEMRPHPNVYSKPHI